NALMTGFRWDFFLLEPLIFILWCATAISMLFWGRGVFCGWLCPFGALQELLNKAARQVGIRQITVKWFWHERLWPIKYILFLGLFALSLSSMATAERFAEVEPFKTVVLLHFARDWPFVIYALTLLAGGLVMERFFCRYLCPLGGALAIPGKGRLFDWLKRRKQCGSECSLCARNCQVQAIDPLGRINVNECLYCMDCQVTYSDDTRCPPLIQRRQGRGRKAAPAAAARPSEAQRAE
ncbi:MAG: 4Fe-4S binding protein, partial [Rhodospirillales bacterium]|nr:4Fe-4S binding protein [Rhodospirillales bacterium]